jgi:hypothetical protein
VRAVEQSQQQLVRSNRLPIVAVVLHELIQHCPYPHVERNVPRLVHRQAWLCIPDDGNQSRNVDAQGLKNTGRIRSSITGETQQHMTWADLRVAQIGRPCRRVCQGDKNHAAKPIQHSDRLPSLGTEPDPPVCAGRRPATTCAARTANATAATSSNTPSAKSGTCIGANKLPAANTATAPRHHCTQQSYTPSHAAQPTARENR